MPIMVAFRLSYRLLPLSQLLLFVGDHKGDISDCGNGDNIIVVCCVGIKTILLLL